MGNQWKQYQALFWGAPKSLQIVIVAMKLKDTYSLEGKLWPTYDQPRQHIKKQRHSLVKATVFPVVMYGCESWTIKKAERRRTDGFELWCWRRLLRDPWEIQPVHPKGNQSWIFIGRTDAEAETPILWPPDAKNWLVGKDPDAGKDWRQKKGTTEDEMVGWWTQVWVSSGSWW